MIFIPKYIRTKRGTLIKKLLAWFEILSYLLQIIGQDSGLPITGRNNGQKKEKKRKSHSVHGDIALHILRPASQFKYYTPRTDGNKFKEEG